MFAQNLAPNISSVSAKLFVAACHYMTVIDRLSTVEPETSIHIPHPDRHAT